MSDESTQVLRSPNRLSGENVVVLLMTSTALALCVHNNWFDALCMTIRHNEIYQMDEFVGGAFLFLAAFVFMFVRREHQLRAQMRAIRRSEAHNHSMARQDFLTGLPNRLALMERLETAPGRAVAFLLLDLDGFKNVNDVHGHAAGDAVLVEVARRLAIAADALSGTFAARLGGDEFGFLLDRPSADSLNVIMAIITASLDEPIPIQGAQLHISSSIGSAVSLDGARSVDQLLQDADAAMYKDKAHGGGMARKAHANRHHPTSQAGPGSACVDISPLGDAAAWRDWFAGRSRELAPAQGS
ncbi:MAG: hypothetical protein C0494_10570 [Sphingobium sp.]|nr:hypothetical protein [Sphingobium sp.]